MRCAGLQGSAAATLLPVLGFALLLSAPPAQALPRHPAALPAPLRTHLQAQPMATGKSGRARSFGTEVFHRSSEAMRLRGGGGGWWGEAVEAYRGLPYKMQNAYGVLFIIVGVFGSVEAQGMLRARLPKSLSRKMTHVAVGSFMLTGLALLPVGHSWPGKLAICSFLWLFMMGFSVAAYIPDKDLEKLPKLLRGRIERLSDLCRSGDRIELMGGTFLYCAIVAQTVALLGSAPLAVIALSALIIGDGLADPVGRWLGAGKSTHYTFAYFGQKSVPGSLACFFATVMASAAWGKLFALSGHYGADFDQAVFLKSAAILAGAATLAEATSPPMVDNIVVVVACSVAGFVLSESGYAPFLTKSKL